MKFIGGLIVLLYAWVAFSGWEPFTREERGQVPGDVRSNPRGVRYWTGGFMGGK
jgi:hypothetical protein